MPFLTVQNVKIAAVAAAVPVNREDNFEYSFNTEAERDLFLKTVGVRYRRIVNDGTTASDLCFAAAEKLFQELNCNREDFKILIFISQTPDYLIPYTSGWLQNKLGFGKDCMAFDINLGCSGYVYGLSIAASLLNNISSGKALLLVGDCSSSCISKSDKSVAPLFSDAGSATILEKSDGGEISFNLQTDGSEYDDIIINDGGMRSPFKSDSVMMEEIEKGILRAPVHMILDGLKIFNFALREIPGNVSALLSYKNLTAEEIETGVFHQANLLMNESVRKKLKLSAEKVPYSLHDFGNTSSASIPVTLCAENGNKKLSNKNSLLCGFGVGLSWGSCIANLSETKIFPLLEI